MRNFKLLALALIAVFIAVGCAPEADLSKFDWAAANAGRDVAFGPTDVNITVEVENDPIDLDEFPQFRVTFDSQADILKSNDVEGDMKKFLTFNKFSNATEPGKGNASTMSAVGYKLIRTVSNRSVIVELTEKLTDSSSNIVAKVAGNEYKIYNGLFMDLDQDGVPGEADYDDWYSDELEYDGDTSITFTQPGARDWYITLSNTLAFPTFDNSTSNAQTTDKGDIVVGNITVTGISDGDVKKTIADQFAKYISIEELSADGTSWGTPKAAVWDKDVNAYVVKEASFKHNVTYRIKWTADAKKLTTTGKYFGIVQKVHLKNITYTVGVTKEKAYATLEYALHGIRCINDAIIVHIDGNASAPNGQAIAPTVYTSGPDGKKVVLKIANFKEKIAKVSGTDKAVYLETLTLDKFNESVIFAIGDINLGGNYKRINVTGVEFKKTLDSQEGSDYILVTLDPSIQWEDQGSEVAGDLKKGIKNDVNIFINEGLYYKGSSPLYVFGDKDNFANNFFGKYTSAGLIITPGGPNAPCPGCATPGAAGTTAGGVNHSACDGSCGNAVWYCAVPGHTHAGATFSNVTLNNSQITSHDWIDSSIPATGAGSAGTRYTFAAKAMNQGSGGGDQYRYLLTFNDVNDGNGSKDADVKVTVRNSSNAVITAIDGTSLNGVDAGYSRPIYFNVTANGNVTIEVSPRSSSSDSGSFAIRVTEIEYAVPLFTNSANNGIYDAFSAPYQGTASFLMYVQSGRTYTFNYQDTSLNNSVDIITVNYYNNGSDIIGGTGAPAMTLNTSGNAESFSVSYDDMVWITTKATDGTSQGEFQILVTEN